MSEPTASEDRTADRPEEPKPAEATLRDDPATVDLAAKVTEAWSDFTTALAKALGELAVGSRIDVTVDQAALEGGAPIYEVSVACAAAGQLAAHAVGNTMLPDAYRLSRTAIGELVALGWTPPGAGGDHDERYSLALAQDQAPRVAAVLTRTLRDVYSAPHPAFLLYTVESESVAEGEAGAAPTPPAVPPLGPARLLSTHQV